MLQMSGKTDSWASEAPAPLDGILRAICDVCNAPAAAVSLSDRVFGVFRVPQPQREAVRYNAVATIAADGDIMAAEAAAARDRFVWAYAPLHDTGGVVVGSVSIIDEKPRRWTREETDRLLRLAPAVAAICGLQEAVQNQDRRESFEALRHRALLEIAREGLVVQDRSGQVIEANPAAARILGLPEAGIVGRHGADPVWRLTRQDGSELPAEETPSLMCLATGRPVRNHIVGLARPDGQRRWIDVTAEPVFRDDDVTPYQVLVSFIDITERRVAEEDRIAQWLDVDMGLRRMRASIWEYSPGSGQVVAYGALGQGAEPKLFANAEALRALVAPQDRDRVEAEMAAQLGASGVAALTHKALDETGQEVLVTTLCETKTSELGEVRVSGVTYVNPTPVGAVAGEADVLSEILGAESWDEARSATAAGLILRLLAQSRPVASGDIVNTALLLGIWRGNVEHLASQGRAPGEGGYYADEERRPIAIYVIGEELGIPFETARRRISSLAAQGLCRRVSARGFIVPSEVLASEAFRAMTGGLQGELARYFKKLR